MDGWLTKAMAMSWKMGFCLFIWSDSIFMIRQLKYGRSTNSSRISLSYATKSPCILNSDSVQNPQNLFWTLRSCLTRMLRPQLSGNWAEGEGCQYFSPLSSFSSSLCKKMSPTPDAHSGLQIFSTLIYCVGRPIPLMRIKLYYTQSRGRSSRRAIPPLLGDRDGDEGGLLQVFSSRGSST